MTGLVGLPFHAETALTTSHATCHAGSFSFLPYPVAVPSLWLPSARGRAPQRCVQRVQGRHMCDWCPPCSPIMIGRRQSPVQCGDWTGHSAVQYPRMARWRSGWGGSCGLNQSGSSAGLKQNHCGYGQLSGRNNLWGERGRATVTRQPSRLDHGPGSSQGYDGS